MFRPSMIFALATLALTIVPLRAGDRLKAEFTMDTASKFVWRGDNLVDDQVYQPKVSLSTMGFSLEYLGNIDATDINGEEHEFTEHDLDLSYSLHLGKAGSLEAGYIYYYFPSAEDDLGQDDRDTAELYLSYDISPGGLFDVSLAGYYDIDEIDGWYASAGLGKEFELESNLVAGIGATVGYASNDYNTDYWGVKGADWNELVLSASLSGPLTKSLHFSVSFNYSEFLDGAIADDIDAGGGNADNFWVVMGLSMSF